MSASGNAAYEVTEIEFGRAGDVPLLARLYSPKGVSGFPAIVDVHGGAWTGGSRMDNASMHPAIAASGIMVLALEFRLAPGTPYPGPVADINLGSGGDGTRAVAAILKIHQVPVIFVTAYPERLLTGDAVEPAFVITKPFEPLTLAIATYQAVSASHKREQFALAPD